MGKSDIGEADSDFARTIDHRLAGISIVVHSDKMAFLGNGIQSRMKPGGHW